MTKRLKIFLAALLGLLFMAAGFGLHFVRFMSHSVGPQEPVVFVVKSGAPFVEVARQLEEEGLVDSAFYFKSLAWIRDETRRIKAGEYVFDGEIPPGQVLDRLVAGDVRRHKFTIPEGFTLKEIALKLAAEGFCDSNRFLALAKDAAFINTVGLSSTSLEGYLFPETYSFEAGMSPERILQAMARQFSSRLPKDLVDQAKKRGLNIHQLVTLASIVQKEAGSVEEMPLISAVFHNRLKKGISLQADPTVIYGLEHFDGNLTRRDLERKTPYNTYRIVGLPPGPIANPGEDALRAAAYPAQSNYLYFVAKGDGSHAFSSTLKEHNRAVRRYQLHR